MPKPCFWCSAKINKPPPPSTLSPPFGGLLERSKERIYGKSLNVRGWFTVSRVTFGNLHTACKSSHIALAWEGPFRVTGSGKSPGKATFSITWCLQSFKLQSPSSPLGPWGPWGPISPVGPWTPAGPCFPRGPVLPVSPLSPLGPGSPGGPCCPGGPGIIVALTIYKSG